VDVVNTIIIVVGIDFAELFGDLIGFQVEAFNRVIVAATFDGGPVDDRGAAGKRIAHVGLLENFIEASAGFAGGQEFIAGEIGTASAIDGFDQAGFDGVGDGDFEVQIPRTVDG
jgi:hypothetical protein